MFLLWLVYFFYALFFWGCRYCFLTKTVSCGWEWNFSDTSNSLLFCSCFSSFLFSFLKKLFISASVFIDCGIMTKTICFFLFIHFFSHFKHLGVFTDEKLFISISQMGRKQAPKKVRVLITFTTVCFWFCSKSGTCNLWSISGGDNAQIDYFPVLFVN